MARRRLDQARLLLHIAVAHAAQSQGWAMTASLHIFNRNGVYYWRRRLPRHFLSVFQLSALVLSLHTGERKTARRIAGILDAEFNQFQHVMTLEKRAPTEDEAKVFLKALYRRITEECRDEQARYYHPSEMPEAWQGSVVEDSNDPAVIASIDHQAAFHDPQFSAELLQQDRAAHRYAPIRWFLEPILAPARIDAGTDTHAFRRFLSLAQQLAIKAFQDAAAEISGELAISGIDDLAAEARTGFVTSSLNAVTMLPAQASAASKNGPEPACSHPPKALSHYVTLFLKESEAQKWKKGTHNQYRVALQLMLRILGDKPAGTITRDDAKYLHSTMQKLPSSFGKSSSQKTMAIEEALEVASGDAKVMVLGTLERHWRNIKVFFKWLNREDGVPWTDIDRVFGGHIWGKDVPEGDGRVIWDGDSLNALFASPIWTGFKPHPAKRYWRHQTGSVVIQDEYWWLPLLAAFQGARLEELCMLRGIDICILEDVDAMKIYGSHLKTASSKRNIPIHSKLKALGFLQFAKQAGDSLLFPKTYPDGVDGKLGHLYSSDFSGYRKHVGVYKEKMDFHSFRHNFTTQMMNADVSILVIDEITGHDSKSRKELKEAQSVSLDYHFGYDIGKMVDAIEVVSYPEVDIDRLLLDCESSLMHEAELERRFPSVWGKSPARRAKPTKA